jgi:hypothetical protein
MIEQLSSGVGAPRRIAHAFVTMTPSPPSAFLQNAICWLTEFSQLTVRDQDMAARVRIAVAELTENVVKYGRNQGARVDVALEQRGGALYMVVETTNSAPERHIERAVEILTGIRDSEDPVAFYDQLILAVAPTREVGVSGLGLARIRAEGELHIDYRLEGDRLTIFAETPIAGSHAA